MVDGRVAADGAVDADGHRDRERQRHRRARSAAAWSACARTTRQNAGSRWKNDWPKSPRDDVAHEAGELHRQRIVASPAPAAGAGAVGLGRLRHDEGDRVAAGVEDREGDQRDARAAPRPDGRAGGSTNADTTPHRVRRLSSRRLGVEEPEPLVAARRVLAPSSRWPSVSYCVHRKIAGASSRIICLDLRVGPLAPGLVHRRARPRR